MPFIRVDAETYDELVSELPEEMSAQLGNRPSGNFEYQAANAVLDLKALDPVNQLLREALCSTGATMIRASYDGGYDEGFSHFEYVTIQGINCSANDVTRRLADSPLPGTLRQQMRKQFPKWNAETGDVEMIDGALFEFIDHCASVLLGEGFGTGEYELYGAFTLDLSTGNIADDPQATAPESKE